MFIIEDWAGNRLYADRTFESFEDAEDFLCDELGDSYDTEREEIYITEEE